MHSAIHTVNSLENNTFCDGCSKNCPDDLNQCRICRGQYCEHCSCACEVLPSTNLLIAKAGEIILSFQGESQHGNQVIFTIEDQYGSLEHVEGSLQSLINSHPKFNQLFASQLPAGLQKRYEDLQLAVWGKGQNGRAQVCTLCKGWGIAILPLFVQGEKYTVTLFLADEA